MQTILRNQDFSNSLPTPTISPTFTPTPTPTTPSPTPTTPAPTPSPDPVNYTKRLTIDPDTTVTQRGVLRGNETMTYIVSGSQNQTLETVISGDGVLMTIIGPDGRPVDSRAQRVSYWQGSLPFNGDYFVELRPVTGMNNGRYDLDVTLRSASRPSPVPTPTPTPTPIPLPTPTPSPTPPPTEPRINEIPVEFPPGDTSQSFSDRIKRNVINRYVVSAPQGAQLTAQMYGGTTLRVYNSAGQVVSSNGATYWQAIINYDTQYKPGVYRIDALGAKGTDYTLDLSLVNR
jgi:serine/threonine-protein kinase